MKTSLHATLLSASLICILLASVQVFSRQDSETDDQLKGTLKVNGLDIQRSTVQPIKRYDGERLVLTTSIGNTVKERFYGVFLILKYEAKQVERARAMLFTEKNYLVEENYDFNAFKYFERSWSPDENGVWSDALALGDDTPLPSDYRRVIRQELFCDGTLFSRALIVFTPTSIEFLPQSLSAKETSVRAQRPPLDKHRKRGRGIDRGRLRRASAVKRGRRI